MLGKGLEEYRRELAVKYVRVEGEKRVRHDQNQALVQV